MKTMQRYIKRNKQQIRKFNNKIGLLKTKLYESELLDEFKKINKIKEQIKEIKIQIEYLTQRCKIYWRWIGDTNSNVDL